MILQLLWIMWSARFSNKDDYSKRAGRALDYPLLYVEIFIFAINDGITNVLFRIPILIFEDQLEARQHIAYYWQELSNVMVRHHMKSSSSAWLCRIYWSSNAMLGLYWILAHMRPGGRRYPKSQLVALEVLKILRASSFVKETEIIG